jgi:hypothetical protein
MIEEQFDTAALQDDWSPRYNIAPTQPVLVIRQHPKEPRQISTMRWGLVPYWAKDLSIATGTINAKSETAATKTAFREPLKFRRCLIPADGFYEWQRRGNSKQPFCFEVNNGGLFASPDCGMDGRTQGGDGKDLLDPDDNRKCRDLGHPRQDASDPRSEQLRPTARSGNAERRSDLGSVEALRCSADAMLSVQHADQSCGERRRRVFATRRDRRGTKSAFLVRGFLRTCFCRKSALRGLQPRLGKGSCASNRIDRLGNRNWVLRRNQSLLHRNLQFQPVGLFYRGVPSGAATATIFVRLLRFRLGRLAAIRHLAVA